MMDARESSTVQSQGGSISPALLETAVFSVRTLVWGQNLYSYYICPFLLLTCLVSKLHVQLSMIMLYTNFHSGGNGRIHKKKKL